jgi:hypothetical protein
MRLQDYVDANSRLPAMEEMVSRMQEISSTSEPRRVDGWL